MQETSRKYQLMDEKRKELLQKAQDMIDQNGGDELINDFIKKIDEALDSFKKRLIKELDESIKQYDKKFILEKLESNKENQQLLQNFKNQTLSLHDKIVIVSMLEITYFYKDPRAVDQYEQITHTTDLVDILLNIIDETNNIFSISTMARYFPDGIKIDYTGQKEKDGKKVFSYRDNKNSELSLLRKMEQIFDITLNNIAQKKLGRILDEISGKNNRRNKNNSNLLEKPVESINELLPIPTWTFRDKSKTTKSIFDQRNHLNDQNNLELAGYTDNTINVWDEKKPIENIVSISFDKKTLDQGRASLGMNPFTLYQYEVFNGLCSFILKDAKLDLDYPYNDILRLQKKGPWYIKDTDLIKHCFKNVAKPTREQREQIKECFLNFMKTTITLDNLDLVMEVLPQQLNEYYQRNNLDRSNFEKDLEYYLTQFTHFIEISPFIDGRIRIYPNDNKTESVVFVINKLPPLIINTLLTKRMASIPEKYYLPIKGIKVKNGAFYSVYNELVDRIHEGITLITDDKLDIFNKQKKAYLLNLDIENIFEIYGIKFPDNANGRRSRMNLLKKVVENINELAGGIPYFAGAMIYPPQPRKRKTHVVLSYRGQDNKRICSDKFRECLEYQQKRK